MTIDRIERVVVTPIAFPDPPLLNVAGIHEPLALRTIVQVYTANGQVGVGEAHGGAALLQTIHLAGRTVTGMSSYEIENARSAVHRQLPHLAERAFAPIEVAMLDAFAQRINCRVVDLLGGAAREHAEFAGYLFYKLAHHLDADQPDQWGEVLTAAQVVDIAQRMHRDFGFTSWKLKGAVHPISTELDAIMALRDAFPAAPLRLDPNARWSMMAAYEAGERMRGTLEYLEDPAAGHAAMVELTAQGPLPTATNMRAGSTADTLRTIAHRAADIVLLDHHVVGGLRRAVELSRLCHAAGIGVSMHSNSHLGVSMAAMTHLAAAVRGDTRANDTHYPWNRDHDIIVGGPIPIVDGHVQVPEGPGLGVQVDDDQLAQAHQRYVETTIRERNDAAYARCLIPDFGTDTEPWTTHRSGWFH